MPDSATTLRSKEGTRSTSASSQGGLLRPTFGGKYPTIVKGQGPYLFDETGRQYFDGSSGAMTANLGHGLQDIARGISVQAGELAFVFRNQFTSRQAEQLADRLCDLAPGDLNGAFFVNSGSEASEYAIRMSLHYWKERGKPSKVKILGRSTSYHGMTMGALSMSGHAGRRPDYSTLLHDFPAAPPANCYRCPFDLKPQMCALECAGAWKTALDKHDPETVAAVIVEPIVGAAGGVLMPPPGYLKRLRQICDAYDVLLIVDEVITGLGRTGSWFACDDEGIVPDLLLLAKGLSAGYTPMGAVLVRQPIIDAISSGSGQIPFGHTFSANPLSASICMSVLNYIDDNNILENVRLRSAELKVRLDVLAQKFACMADVRGRGLLFGFEFVKDHITREPPAAVSNASARFAAKARDNGLVVYPAGIAPLNNAIIVSPPLTITEQQVGELSDLLESTLEGFVVSQE